MRDLIAETDKQARNKATGRMATGTDPYSQATLNTTPSGNNPGPTGANHKDGKYSSIDFKIPGSVRAAAEKGLELRKWNIENGRKSQPGGTGIGVARARWLKSEDEAHPRGIRRMASYLGRKPFDSKRDKNGKWAPSYVAWMLWGGAPAKAWAGKLVRQMDAADEESKNKDEDMREGMRWVKNASLSEAKRVHRRCGHQGRAHRRLPEGYRVASIVLEEGAVRPADREAPSDPGLVMRELIEALSIKQPRTWRDFIRLLAAVEKAGFQVGMGHGALTLGRKGPKATAKAKEVGAFLRENGIKFSVEEYVPGWIQISFPGMSKVADAALSKARAAQR